MDRRHIARNNYSHLGRDYIRDDWQAMVDSVMIDTAYDGEVFNITLSDVPEKKSDLVAGIYELGVPEGKSSSW